MNFYGKNFNQDKLFVEIRNSLELAYWIASDNDHFVESFPEMIDKNILRNIYSNSSKLEGFLNKTTKKINNLEGQHKKCATLLAKYTEFCIEEFSIKLKSSESDEENFLRIINADLRFRSKFNKYYLKTDVEFYRSRAYSQLSYALLAMLDFTVYSADELDSTLAENKRKDVIEYLSSAEKTLGIGNRLMKANNVSTRDFSIAYSGKTCNSIEDYYDLQVELNMILKELFFIQRDLYEQLKDDHLDLSEIKLYDYETQKYYGKMNIIGYKIGKLILEEMNIDIPNFEIFSPLTIKDQLDFIKVK
tara:strand:+ start:1119 stop:2030 length:912 start_codon:yes stop_codon:yes gene_type:complete